MAPHETLLYEERDGVAWVTLNRPDVHNAFNSRMQLELRDLWRSLRTRDEVNVVVLTGAGDKAFCTGIDREEIVDPAKPRERPVGPVSSRFHFDDPGEDLGPKTNDLWKPIVAAVNGMACGGAFYLLGESDIIIAAEHATFFDPHTTYGMAAVYESIQMMHRMPFGEVMRMQLLGVEERMSSQRAHQIGLVSEVVPADGLLEAAGWVAGVIARQPPLAVQGTLRTLWAARELSRGQALREVAFAYVGIGTDDESLRQGQERFRSGDRPKWRLR